MADTHKAVAARRPYHSPARRRQAEQTSLRILAEARELFRSAGYAATTMAGIASAAGVSVKTVEAIFGSKRGVLAAAVDPLASGGPPGEMVELVRAAEDPRTRLGLVAELAWAAYSASVPELELMRGAATVAPEIAAVARLVGSRRRANQTRLIAFLSERGVLRADLGPEEAVDIAWTLTSYDVYRALVSEQRWPPDRYRAWLAGALADSLLAR
jgi:AcrR family transcriptional regulator